MLQLRGSVGNGGEAVRLKVASSIVFTVFSLVFQSTLLHPVSLSSIQLLYLCWDGVGIPKRAKVLSALDVKRLGEGFNPVGGVAGLVLVVRDTREATRRQYNAEEKIRIVLEGLRGEESIAELCRREGINTNLYYRWSKDFLETGKKRLAGDTAREATSDEVKQLRSESAALKEVLAEQVMEIRLLKKSVIGDGEDDI